VHFSGLRSEDGEKIKEMLTLGKKKRSGQYVRWDQKLPTKLALTDKQNGI
jgi:hypothetical protein